jgi:hypothetical protein
MVLRDVTLCRQFRGTSELEVPAASVLGFYPLSEVFVPIYWFHMRYDHNLDIHHCENVRYYEFCSKARAVWWLRMHTLKPLLFCNKHLHAINLFFKWHGHALAQMVSCWPVTMEDCVQSQASPCGICFRISSKYFGFASSVLFYQCFILVHLSVTNTM